MLEKIIALLAPHQCVICGAEGSLLCTWCKPHAVSPLPDRCYRCNSVTEDSRVCKKCRRQSPLRHVWVRAQYADTTKELVYMLKFSRARAAAKSVAPLLEEKVPDLPKDTLVTYIPTATSRVRLRGYDQSKLIAKEFARLRGLPFATLLVRYGQSRQVGSDRKHRIAQAAKNYQVNNEATVPGRSVLVIDDIVTTGATLEAAAKLLKMSGAKTVSAAVFAQKQ